VTLVLVAALALLALRPVPLVEAGLDWLLVPARGLAELSAPMGWFQSRDALAADPDQKRERELERERHDLLERVVLDSAQPSDPRLLGRLSEVSWTRAEVVERRAHEPDRIVIRVEDPHFPRQGQPVVSGDSFVGTIDLRTGDAESHDLGLVEVLLITERNARIGARVERRHEDAPVGGNSFGGNSSGGALAGSGASSLTRMVVGGLAPRRSLHLDVHNPSDRNVLPGTVVVDESDPDAGPTYLADGFLLGEFVNEPYRAEDSLSGAPATMVLGVAPGLDYATGLYQVLVLGERHTAPTSTSTALAKTDVLDDEGWLPARLYLRGETSPWRKGRKLALGSRNGVETDAALASGTRLAGRVTRAGPWTADVALVGDPGFAIPVVALLHGLEQPVAHVLGRLVGFGRRAGGVVRFRWSATLELSPDLGPTVQATLWTGSGEAGMPRGLLLGETLLPTGPGPHWVDVQLPDGGAEPKGLKVRVAIPVEEQP